MRDSSRTRSNVSKTANARLWSGLHPNALALLYDDTRAIGIYCLRLGCWELAAVMIDVLRDDAGQQGVETTVLRLVQEIHWTIHMARSPTTKTSPSSGGSSPRHRRAHRSIYGHACRRGMVREEARNANVDELSEDFQQ